MKILVVGSIAFDTIETPAASVEDSPGGSALYFSIAASFFAPVNVVGVVGTDFNLSDIEIGDHRPINFDGLYTEPGETFRWGGRYYADPNKRDTLFTHLNVFENFQPKIPESYRNSEIVFLANIDPDLQLQVLEQMNKPRLVVMDTMNFWISGKRDSVEKVISKTDILIVNDEETRQLTGAASLIQGAREILEMGPSTVIVKKGEHGAVMLANDSYFVAPAYPVSNVIDPTGAGDTFAGGLVGYLARGGVFTDGEIRQALIYGSVVASFNVEDFSFKRLLGLTEKDLHKRFEEFRKFTAY